MDLSAKLEKIAKRPLPAEALLTLGRQLAQGYHIGRPIPTEEFESKWLIRPGC